MIDKQFEDFEKRKAHLAENIPSEEMYRGIINTIHRKQVRRVSLAIAAVFVPILIIFGAVLLIDRNVTGGLLFSKLEMTDQFVPNGEKTQMVFQDGSRIFLNAGSHLTYPNKFRLRSREVYLDGEAFFEVMHNHHRPFIVHIPDGAIRVLGTSFNVKAYSEDQKVIVALVEGQVQIATSLLTYDLEPSDVLYYDCATHRGRIVREDVRSKTDWTANTISFKSAPLDEIAVSLSRLYDVNIHLSDSLDKNRLYTFTTTRTDLDLLLRELEIIAPIKVQREGDEIFIEPLK